MRKTHKQRTLILQLPRDGLTAFYRWMVAKYKHVVLQAPMWGNHVTVVGGLEQVPNMHLWKAHEGQQLVFELSPNVIKHHDFWVMPARAVRFNELRRELGLPPWTEFHLTIGREYT